MYYASFGVLSLLITLIINHSVLSARKTDRVSSKIRYKRFLWSVIVYFISDILWGFLYEWHLAALVYADTVIYFASMAVSVLLWTIYVVNYLKKKNAFSTILTYSGWIIMIYGIAALIINFFTPVVFTFDANGAYCPGNARYVALFAQIILFMTESVYSLSVAIKVNGKAKLQHRTIGYSGIVMTVFIVLQTFFPLLPFYAVGCLIVTCLVHTFIAADEKKDYYHELGMAKQKAYIDSLTGVKSSSAYAEAKEQLEEQIDDGSLTEFGVVVFDLNGLKTVNDTMGHEAGDKYLEEAGRLICDHFKHSPVFRIGGDEFAVILEGEDYQNRSALIEAFEGQIDMNVNEGSNVIVSSGMSEFVPGEDDGFNAVFTRADQKMYERKRDLKKRSPVSDNR